MSIKQSASTRPPKVPERGIPLELIKAWIDPKNMGTLNPGLARALVAEFFCGTIMTRGVCPENCQACRHEVVDLFRLNGAKNAAALLTWMAKDHAAKWIEKLIAQQRQNDFPAQESASSPASEQAAYQNLFPRRGPEKNIFLELSKDYDE